MNHNLSSSCIYTIRHSRALADDYGAGGSGTFKEKARWVTGSRIHQQACKAKKRVPILFGPAEADTIDGVSYWGLIDAITLKSQGTEISFSSLQKLPRKHRLSSLRKLSDDAPLSDNYIRPYVPCKTPKFILSAPVSSQLALHDIEAEEISAREGAISARMHLHRERDRTIIVAKRKQVLSSTGKLACSVCGFDFRQFYGEIGEGFCEVHHLCPLAIAGKEVQTHLDDLAIVCSNCHRMIHICHPFLTIAELKARIRAA
ncbi:HNH endonuclease [Prosthecobacter sp.]|uniref:HNH endonuclease n=1 Tax=Prosthecobacter sp. TaxID=1965333 RepID=UPI001D552FF7|nr:HNH endonuclease [Prosthecobacter sp.]MCB1275995.1 HNH endonuclease [Prosthecobacter sp.]